MTNEQINQIARKQSAIDANCSPEDFLMSENKVVISAAHPNARKYLELPLYCNLISYGNNIVASVNSELTKTVKEYIDSYPKEHCFETPNFHVLNDALEKRNHRICFMAEYFLPDIKVLKALPCEYEIRLLTSSDFNGLYREEWSNALCEKRKHLDVLAAAAYDGNKLIGMAGCSADCATMWQIGIDVLPEYQRRGIAAALTSHLALEILERDKVPFYCAAWSNIRSVRNGIKSGFRPAWVEMTAKPKEFVNKMNKIEDDSPS
ncbi:GNAT family N-acetyltransferase [Anaerocolumna jejuensis]|uniref:GNAT family N-acetyltransferase n=1 Tax=Anaerocolumna jejuensis TaxID=259063 RepID=UPI003F7BD46F